MTSIYTCSNSLLSKMKFPQFLPARGGAESRDLMSMEASAGRNYNLHQLLKRAELPEDKEPQQMQQKSRFVHT